MTGLEGGYFLPRRFFQLQHFRRIPIEPAACLGGRYLPCPALEEGDSQFLLQKVHLGRKRRLGNMELPRCPGDGSFFYNGFKIIELP